MGIIRTNSRSARRREWREQTRLRLRLEVGLQRSLSKELRRVSTMVAKGFRSGGRSTISDTLIADHKEQLLTILRRGHQRTFSAFGSRIFIAAKVSNVVMEIKDERSEFSRLTAAWIKKFGARKVAQISRTTRDRIRGVIATGIDLGEGQEAIARRIVDDTGGAVARTRAAVIARTEVHQASQASTAIGREALGLPPESKFEWITASDGLVRDTHTDADGQTRSSGEFFDVGAAKLAYPGDPSGPAEEIINCRCVAPIVLE